MRDNLKKRLVIDAPAIAVTRHKQAVGGRASRRSRLAAHPLPFGTTLRRSVWLRAWVAAAAPSTRPSGRCRRITPTCQRRGQPPVPGRQSSWPSGYWGCLRGSLGSARGVA
jgi:hypothetical protein